SMFPGQKMSPAKAVTMKDYENVSERSPGPKPGAGLTHLSVTATPPEMQGGSSAPYGPVRKILPSRKHAPRSLRTLKPHGPVPLAASERHRVARADRVPCSD
ncbi:hypothetical protein P4O66_021040, partial [Electrophorus voltai]